MSTEDRSQIAYRVRVNAAELARSRIHPLHRANGDEQRFASAHYAMSFTKGLKHDDETGLVAQASHFEAFRSAIDNGFIEPFTACVPGVMDPGRPWEAPTAGVVCDLEGPDTQAVTMPPAPAAGTAQLAYEMAEVYWLAVLRDCPLTLFARDQDRGASDLDLFNPEKEPPDDDETEEAVDRCSKLIEAAVDHLNDMDYDTSAECCDDGQRPRLPFDSPDVTRGTVFRGASPGVAVGPYLSQFMLIGTGDQNGTVGAADGKIAYGAITVDQRVAKATPGLDFMTGWQDWLEVQDGADKLDNGVVFTENDRRFITTPRDLATYVHFDALYEAYLNACVILLNQKCPFDPAFGALSGQGRFGYNTGAPQNFQSPATAFPRKAGGFALYGGPHVLTLVTEVATRALKAVRFQKFNSHIRLRPEALAARIDRAAVIEAAHPTTKGVFSGMREAIFGENLNNDLHDQLTGLTTATHPYLLPMAFQEGSPMHPSYGAGHATVAGACVTILKAFFDTDAVFVSPEGTGDPVFKRFEAAREAGLDCDGVPVPARDGDVPAIFVPDHQGETLCNVGSAESPCLTLEGELNKLAANISIGRNMAGVHYFSDYYDSLRMGEAIAIGILEEQALCYPTDLFVMTVPTFDGPVRRIGRRGA